MVPPVVRGPWRRHHSSKCQSHSDSYRSRFCAAPPSHGLQENRCRATGGDKEMVDILALVLRHDEQAVLAAVEMALAAGVPTKTHVLNMVSTGWSMARWLAARRLMPRKRWSCTMNPRPMSNAMMACAPKLPGPSCVMILPVPPPGSDLASSWLAQSEDVWHGRRAGGTPSPCRAGGTPSA